MPQPVIFLLIVCCVIQLTFHMWPPLVSNHLSSNKKLAWENSQHLAMLPLVSLPNDIWEMSAEILYWWSVTTQIWVSSASDWSYRVVNLIQPIRSTTQIWVVALHQYRISMLISPTSFGGETSGSVVKCRLFSQANRQPIQNTTIFPFNPLNPKVTNIYFLPTISVHNQEKRLWELMK